MLRNVIAALGAFLFAGGLLAWLAGGAGPGAMIAGAVLVLAILFERVIYKPNAKAPPGPGWVKTAERFVDDQTGKPVTVYVKPETGERIYVEE
jgi:hypothetical protein